MGKNIREERQQNPAFCKDSSNRGKKSTCIQNEGLEEEWQKQLCLCSNSGPPLILPTQPISASVQNTPSAQWWVLNKLFLKINKSSRSYILIRPWKLFRVEGIFRNRKRVKRSFTLHSHCKTVLKTQTLRPVDLCLNVAPPLFGWATLNKLLELPQLKTKPNMGK
jgi:hypothetical protein